MLPLSQAFDLRADHKAGCHGSPESLVSGVGAAVVSDRTARKEDGGLEIWCMFAVRKSSHPAPEGGEGRLLPLPWCFLHPDP